MKFYIVIAIWLHYFVVNCTSALLLLLLFTFSSVAQIPNYQQTTRETKIKSRALFSCLYNMTVIFGLLGVNGFFSRDYFQILTEFFLFDLSLRTKCIGAKS